MKQLNQNRFMLKTGLLPLLLFVCLCGNAQSKQEAVRPVKRVVNAYDIMSENEAQNRSYGVFMRIPSISSGVYT
jgi:hypothetical protein